MSQAIRRFFARLAATNSHRSHHGEKVISAVGGFAGIFGIYQVSAYFLEGAQQMLIVASMGASAVLLFAVPHGPLSQPWPLVGGQTISAIIGVTCAYWIPGEAWAASVGVGAAIGAMYYLRCIHPPGGATALTSAVGGPAQELGYSFVLTPVLLNALTILLVAVVVNYPFGWRRYPAALTRAGIEAVATVPPL